MNLARRAVISPWVRERAGVRPRSTRLAECVGCGTAAFAYRFDDAELTRLYAGYRGSEYFAQRSSWEPSYTSELNGDLGGGDDVVASRRAALDDILKKNARPGEPNVACAIDVGGDRGQFIPLSIPRRYVVEVSGHPPHRGVVALSSVADPQAADTDLVMMCGILEHLPDPAAFVTETLSGVAWGRQRLLYVEVPAGVPSRSAHGVQRAAFPIGFVASHARAAWRSIDRNAAAARRDGRSWRLMPLRMSEHLNFFTPGGLTALVKRLCGRVILCDEYDVASRLTESGRLGFDRTLRLLAEVPTRGEVAGP